MRVSMDENEENEKFQLRDHPQNTTTLGIIRKLRLINRLPLSSVTHPCPFPVP